MNRERYSNGLKLLSQPVLPLVTMVEFLYMTGPFSTVEEVIKELPEPIETNQALYERPKALLERHIDVLKLFEDNKAGREPLCGLVTEQGDPVDNITTGSCWVNQQILTAELEKINSALCAPCNCSLCCVGPDASMQQDFFEIPLSEREANRLATALPERFDNAESRTRLSMDEEPLLCNGRPFYERTRPGLFHWRNGWSMILPKESTCPNLEPGDGRCRDYEFRPEVCRRPQIFPYIIEPLHEELDGRPLYRLRQSLLAITDCPYVNDLKDEIAKYAAACDLGLVLMRNKQ